MRPTLLVGGIVGALCCIWTVRAQLLSGSEHSPAVDPNNVYPAIMTITKDNTYAHSCGEQRFHKTYQFQKNDKVYVLRRSKRFEGGWLEIKPPPGSFNWIRKSDVKMKPDSLVAIADGNGRPKVEIIVGSTVNGEQVNGTWQIEAGTEVVRNPRIPNMVRREENYIAIDVLPNQVHYIPETIVEGSKREAAPSNLVPQMTPAAELVAQAEKAFQADHLREAETFYVQALEKSTDPDQKRMIAKRRDEVRDKIKASYRDTRISDPRRLASNSYTRNAQTVSFQQTETRYRPARFSQSFRSNSSRDHTIGQAKWHGWGYLRRSALTHPDGRQMYQLVSRQGLFINYALVTSDRTLEPLVGKLVNLGGPTMRNVGADSMRTEYILVTAVAQP